MTQSGKEANHKQASRFARRRTVGQFLEATKSFAPESARKKQMKRLVFALSLICSISARSADNPADSARGAQRPAAAMGMEANAMKIHLTINSKSLTATLIDSPTTRDFIALLPLTLKLNDYASTEKIAYLPKKLFTQGAPDGIDPGVGDITYYAPWGNLAIFYRDFGYSTGLIRLGRFEGSIEVLKVSGSLNVTIEAVGK